MKIKRLELSGFKSFVDRTVVNFDHAIMGIVGPNGCGKSNIVDAIRWSMGEQSAKHLRGKSMEDVIFSGSETRPGADFAEVTLTFENDDPTDVPIEFRDYAEIAVTRRLHRSGDSEYLINKTAVRLKDVTDLFLGTGVGTKAYSIVEQGKIGLIVSAKPEDRRLLIEEAAGITKFKSRKKQAERKMELTQQNLLRVGDIVAEIERSLGSLKRQAAKAERFLAYRAELEDLQLHDAAHRYLELHGYIALETGEVERLSRETEGARASLSFNEAELEAVRGQAHAAEQALEHANARAFAVASDLQAEKVAVERARDRLGALRQREAQAAGELRDVAAQRGAIGEELAAVEGDVHQLEASEGDFAGVLAAEDEKPAALAATLTAREAEAAALRQRVSETSARIAAAAAKREGFERRRGDLLARRDQLAEELDQREGAVVELSAKVEQLALAIEDLKTGKVATADEKLALEQRLAGLRREIGVSEQALEDVKAAVSKKRSRLHALSEMHARREGVGAGTKALCATGDRALAGLLADRVDAPAALTGALAGLLGAHLQDVVVEDTTRGVELLAQLAAHRRGRATIVPRRAPYVAGRLPALQGGDDVQGRLVDSLTYAPEDEALVRAVVGEALVVTDSAAALRLRAARDVLVPLVTLDGTVFHADGRISGGTGEEAAAHMLEVNREMRELGSVVTELEARLAERVAQHQALRAKIGETQGALERAQQDAHASELALVHAEKDLRATETELDGHRRRVAVLSAETEEVARKVEEADAERIAAAAAFADAEEEHSRLSAAISGTDSAAASARDEVRAQQQLVTDRKVGLASAREKLSAGRATLQRLGRSEAELAERARRLDAELEASAREFGETAAAYVRHAESLAEAGRAQAGAETELAASRADFDATKGALQSLETALKEQRAHSETARTALMQHEMALRERVLARDHLVTTIREKFRGLELRRIVGDYHLRPPTDAEHRQRIQELSGLLDRMGSVNLDAMREHEEAEKRFAFYSGQKTDLDKALADLERAIQQMNRESKKLFSETFTAVNARFQEIFPKMFRGGRAELRLTNADDMLETGIDIIAQPPGKKLSSIELMSGGEKALTAVSLIFAIFQIKPSPFCVLDEVDAPLDEANVGRYCDMIREMTDRSQFIMITHIKKTMQMVDVLHGVTMGEPGVSKLVSVNVSEVAKAAKPGPVKVQTAAVA